MTALSYAPNNHDLSLMLVDHLGCAKEYGEGLYVGYENGTLTVFDNFYERFWNEPSELRWTCEIEGFGKLNPTFEAGSIIPYGNREGLRHKQWKAEVEIPVGSLIILTIMSDSENEKSIRIQI